MTHPLTPLLERVRSAEKGDRELDAAIAVVVAGMRRVNENTFYGPDETVYSFGEFEAEHGAWNGPLPRWSTSIDAALGLVKEKLPGWQVITVSDRWTGPGARDSELISNDARTFWGEAYLSPSEHSHIEVFAKAKTPALALLAALLQALIEWEGRRDRGPEQNALRNLRP